MAAPCDAAVTWEYRILTIGVRRANPFSGPASARQTPDNSPAAAKPPTAGPAANTTQDPPQPTQQAQTAADQQEAATPSMSQMYRDLEFPSKYLRNAPAQPAPLPRAKQLEQVLNRLAAEGWEYVGMELLLGEQVVVMRREKAAEPEPTGQTQDETQSPEPVGTLAASEQQQELEPKPRWWHRWIRRRS